MSKTNKLNKSELDNVNGGAWLGFSVKPSLPPDKPNENIDKVRRNQDKIDNIDLENIQGGFVVYKTKITKPMGGEDITSNLPTAPVDIDIEINENEFITRSK